MRWCRTNVIAVIVVACAALPVGAFGPGVLHAAGVTGDPVPPGAFVRLDQAGRPARWDACAPLRWKIAGTRPSTRLRRTTSTVMRELESVSGLRFVFAGRATSAEFASPPADTIVIGSSSNLGVANAGGTASLLYKTRTSGEVSIVGARVVINPVVVRAGTRLSWMLYPIVLHEVGHAVGLAHVNDPHDIMYPQVVRTTSYTERARRALVELGRTKGCATGD